MMAYKNIFALLALAFLMTNQAFSENWKSTLNSRLQEFGQRNWIVIANSAYPKQNAEGIETVYTGAEQLEVLEYVLKQIDKAKHIRPLIMLDKEINYVPEQNAPGARAYREGLINLLEGSSTTMLPHEEIIKKLNTSAELFNVLLLKTDMLIPYTSIFVELDCGYWSEQNEAQLRGAIEANEAAPATE